MQIVIPMSGFGERFRKAGYQLPKPLIQVEGKPIIHHVIDMFPEEENFIFICNEEHLDNKSYNMRSTILDYCPTGKIISIKPRKLGPVHAVLQVSDFIKDEDVALILGDNIFYGLDLKSSFTNKSKINGAEIFIYNVPDPERYGVVEIINDKIISIVEKPLKPKSNLVVTGLYYYDNSVKEIAKLINPSNRNELEIIDLLNKYRKKNKKGYFFKV